MNNKVYTALVANIHIARTALSSKKSKDYANADYLSNFKRMHIMCKTLDIDPRRSPADCALFLTLLKLDRWTNLRSKGVAPQNEGVVDTIYDFHNYIDLGYACDVSSRGKDIRAEPSSKQTLPCNAQEGKKRSCVSLLSQT